ncbi:hypothetical protein [Roseovarius sp. D0-M9]|uniref:hypothetical protein n=1 Tax=Roseovarius sp. D0-M9 TaxID=3127117 RepID=UPI003010484C
MSRWLALAEGAASDALIPPDNMTKPDKTPSNQPEDVFCPVLSNCQVQKAGKNGAPQTVEMNHGFSVGGRPRTWTGKIVSLDAWRLLSEWEKHGPDGRLWNGNTMKWEKIEREQDGR